jgi:hypothetical protein
METVMMNYVQLRQLYDCFGSVFFGYVRAMNIAHQGWRYFEAQELAERINDEPNELNGVKSAHLIEEFENGAISIYYRTRSGNQFEVHHPAENLYYNIEVKYEKASAISGWVDAIMSQQKPQS